MKSKHILVTTDLSQESERAFAPAAQFAGWLDARITLVYVAQDSIVPPLASPAEAAQCLPDLERERSEAEVRLSRQVEAFPSDAEVTSRILDGNDPAVAIADLAREEEVDLVVLSTHGHSGFRRLVLGSVAESIVREVDQPVLTVPRQDADTGAAPFDLSGHVILTSDLSADSLIKFGPMVGLLKSLGCKVTVLHVIQELRAVPHGAPLAPSVPSPEMPKEIAKAEAALTKQSAFLSEDLTFETVVTAHREPADGIVEYAAKHDASLIAISTHGRKGLRRLALGSVATKVLRESSLPVLHFHRGRS